MRQPHWPRPILPGALAVAAVFFLFWKIEMLERAHQLERVRMEVLRTTSMARARLESTINAQIYLARGMVGQVISHPDIDAADFQLIARELIREQSSIRSIQLARNTVITYVYPVQGNEQAIGLHLLELPAQRPAVLRAITTGQTVVAGPVDLVQGGRAFVSRTPIFLSPRDGKGRGPYWGLASLLINCDALYREAGLNETMGDLRFALRGKDALGAKGAVFYGDPAVFDKSPQITEVTLPGGTWELAALPKQGWNRTGEQSDVEWFAGALLALFSGGMVGLANRRRHQLEEANRELNMARQQAERAATERSRFLAAASHDLRQPLHALGIFLGELQERNRQADLEPLIDRVRLSSDALNDLFESLMDISRLDAGAVQPQIGDFPLRPLLERLVVENAPVAIRKGLRLRIFPGHFAVRSDPALLESLLRNLLVNALKYTMQGGVLLGCRRRGDRVHVEVWDTGAGIPASESDNVFTEFYQLDNPERDRRKGLGLGLAIVRRLSGLLDHPVELRSSVGRGTVVRVEVPAGELLEMPEYSAISPAGFDLRGIWVLVIDDDVLVVEATTQLLTEWGCEVAVAATGDAASRLIGQAGRLPDLILCDYRLPGGTGVAILAQLRATTGADLHAYIVSGDTSAEVLRAAESVGCRLMAKPLSPAKLRALLRHVCRQRAGQPEPVESGSGLS